MLPLGLGSSRFGARCQSVAPGIAWIALAFWPAYFRSIGSSTETSTAALSTLLAAFRPVAGDVVAVVKCTVAMAGLRGPRLSLTSLRSACCALPWGESVSACADVDRRLGPARRSWRSPSWAAQEPHLALASRRGGVLIALIVLPLLDRAGHLRWRRHRAREPTVARRRGAPSLALLGAYKL